MTGFQVISLDGLDRLPVGDGLEWRPIRRRLGIRAFGINAYTAEKVGDVVVEEHNEASGHEEVYLVVRGHARFRLGEETIAAPAGTLVYLSDPELVRVAHSEEEGTTVLAIGGWPAKAFEPSLWEELFAAGPLADQGRVDEAIAIMEDAIRQFPENGAAYYHLARFEAQGGRREDAVGHLREALELRPEVREHAEKDKDLAPLLADL